MAFYKLVGTADKHTNWTTRIELDNGKVLSAVPSELTASDVQKVEERGYKVEKVSKEEAEEAQTAAGIDPDVAASGPVFGDSDNQSDSSDAKK